MPARPSDDMVAPSELAALTEYTDLRPIGKGGMGVVFLATHTLMGRPVVLKVMTPAAQEDLDATERFLREIRAAARLDHPNVVKAYAAHQTGRRLVFVMEYVPGDDLARVVEERGPLPVANAAYFVYQAALGLQHAHERKMVHRDIKPSNLLVAKAFGKTVVKVADFGLAKATREHEADPTLTASGRLMGTPHYMAPEQAADAARADIRADVYALGGTLYHLLAGHPPFRGSLVTLLDAHRTQYPEPLEQVRPDVPAELAAVVARMMAKDPTDRFQTPSDVSRALVPFFKPGGGSTEGPSLARTTQSPVDTVRPATPVAIPVGPPPSEPEPAKPSYWKPPTVFRGTDIPMHTAYLNAEDFNPSAAKPPKPPKRNQKKTPMPLGAIIGMTVVVAAVVVGGVAALVVGRSGPAESASSRVQSPGEDVATAPTTESGPVSVFDGTAAGWQPDPLHHGSWEVTNGVLSLAGGKPPTDKAAEIPCALVCTNRTDFKNVRVRITYRRSKPEAFCNLALRTSGGKQSPDVRSSYFDGVVVSLGGVTGNGNLRPPGSVLDPMASKLSWLAAPGVNPDGVTTLVVELAGDTLRTFDAAGNLLLDAAVPADLPPGRIGLWAGAGARLDVLKLEVTELSPPASVTGPPVFTEQLPDLPPKLRVARLEFERDNPATASQERGNSGGKFVITGKSARGTGWNVHAFKWDPAVPGDGNYAVEAIGRATGGSKAMWGYNLTYYTKAKNDYGVYVRLSADGEVAVLPGWFAKSLSSSKAPLVPPTRHPAALVGAVDNRLTTVQIGTNLWVYVNGRLAAGPVKLPADVPSPLVVQLTAQDATSAEVERVTMWKLPGDAVAPVSPAISLPRPIPATVQKANAAPVKGELVTSADARQRFSSGNKQALSGAGSGLLTREGSELVLSHTDRANAWLYFGDPDWTDYDFSARITGTGGPCLFVRANFVKTGEVGPGNNPTAQLSAGLFAFGWSGDTLLCIEGFNQSNGFIRQVGNNGLPRAKLPSVMGTAWHTARVKVRGNTVETYLDDKPILRGRPPMPARGVVGIRTVDIGTLRFADLKVTDPNGKVLFEGVPTLP